MLARISVLMALLPWLISGAAVPNVATITAAPKIKRDQNVLDESVWISTSSGNTMKITPTVIDGVTISASPVDSATPWNSLDGSGIPYLVTPTVSGTITLSSSPIAPSGYPAATGVPPVLRCFGDRVPSAVSLTPGIPFCSPLNATEMLVGQTYWITWDSSWFGGPVDNVKIDFYALPLVGNEPAIFSTNWINNNNGYYPFAADPSMVKSGAAGYGYLTITPQTGAVSDVDNVGTKTGPMIRILLKESLAITEISRLPSDNGPSSSVSSSSNKAKIIAPAVVVPVVVILAIAFGVVYYITKKRKEGQSINLPFVGSSGSSNGSKAQRTAGIHPTTTEDTELDDNYNSHNAISRFDTNNTVQTETMHDVNPFADRNAVSK